LNGGTNNSSNPATYTIASTAITLADPSYTGYTFGGWFTNAGLTGTAVTSIPAGSTGNQVFWAKWTAISYTITYNLNSGTNNSSNPATYTIASTAITLADPSYTGYTFGGWFTNVGLTGTAITSIPAGSTGNQVFWAKWTATTYTITYNLNGGTNGSNPSTYTIASATITLANPTYTGYTFGGWFTNVGLTGTAVTSIPTGSTGNQAFWAKWTAIPYTVTFNSQGAIDPAAITVTAPAITVGTLPTPPTKLAYIFDGWWTSPNGAGSAFTASTPVSANITVYAKWVVKDYDGNIYTTVTIGSQVWLVENLKTTHLNDGTPIPQVTDAGTWNGLFAMGYCWYNNNSATSYGAIYNFYTVWTQKLAPTGWHVPSDNEWYTLWGSVDVGTLKEKGLAHWSDSTGATNSTGFTALPGGERYFVDGSFDGMGSTAYFWSSSQTTITGVAWGIHFESYSSSYQDVMKNGFSVRCIRDY
jgi:Listeria/Bacterioides repeat/Listeria/Bacterioides repeat/Listeria/Bacterioides repeat